MTSNKNGKETLDTKSDIMQNGDQGEDFSTVADIAKKLEVADSELSRIKAAIEYQGEADFLSFMQMTQQALLPTIQPKDGFSFFWASTEPSSPGYFKRFTMTGKVAVVHPSEARTLGVPIDVVESASVAQPDMVIQGDLVLCAMPTAMRHNLLKKYHHDDPNQVQMAAGRDAIDTVQAQTGRAVQKEGFGKISRQPANFEGV